MRIIREINDFNWNRFLNEDFDWVKQVPDVELGKHFTEEDLNEKIFFESGKVIYQLEWDEFNDLVFDGYDDYYFNDVVQNNGEYEDGGDGDWMDEDEVNYLTHWLDGDRLSRLKNLLKRAAKVLDLDGSESTIEELVHDDSFRDAEDYLGANLYRGVRDWGDMVDNYLYNTARAININRWKSLNTYYLNLLSKYNVQIEGTGYDGDVTVTVPFPYKQTIWSWENGQNVPHETTPITNLTEILTKGLDFLNVSWSDYWYEDYDTSGADEEFLPYFDAFMDKIEQTLTEKESEED